MSAVALRPVLGKLNSGGVGDRKWPEAGFPYAYRKQTLANQAVTANVSILAALRPHAPGHFQSSDRPENRHANDLSQSKGYPLSSSGFGIHWTNIRGIHLAPRPKSEVRRGNGLSSPRRRPLQPPSAAYASRRAAGTSVSLFTGRRNYRCGANWIPLLKVQPSLADGRSKEPILQSSRSRSYGAD